MKRAGILGLAIVLMLGLAVTASQASKTKTKKVNSEVDIDAWYFPPPDYDFSFIGNVYSKKAKCVPNRTVTVFFTGGGGHELVGTTTTDSTGDWQLFEDSPSIGDHEAEVEKKKINRRGKKLVCKADVSPTFFLPP
jgi:hypothetical protein